MFLRLALSTLLAFATSSFAQDYNAGHLRIERPTARPTVPGQPGGAAYMLIENNGKQPDRLVAAKSSIAKRTEIHSMIMDGNVMRMREVQNIDIPPQTTVVMQPGDGYHIMLTGLTKPLKAGDQFPLTLTFQKAGKVNVTVMVENKLSGNKEAPASPGHAPHNHSHSHSHKH